MMRSMLHGKNQKITIRPALLKFRLNTLFSTKTAPSKVIVPVLAVERSLRSENSLRAYPVIGASMG